MTTDLTTGATRLPELRAEVQAAIVAALGAAGSKRVTQSAIVNRFLGRGASRATLFRWVRSGLTSGRLAQQAARQARDKAAPRPEPPAPPAADMAGKTAARLPVRPSSDDAAAGPGRRLRTLDRLAKIVADLDRRVACLETPAKLAQAGTYKFQTFMVDAMRKLLPPPIFCESCFFFRTDPGGTIRCGKSQASINATDLGCKNYIR